MKIKIGTIYELTGEGYEILVDVPTRSVMLARFFDGKMICEAAATANVSEATAIAA